MLHMIEDRLQIEIRGKYKTLDKKTKPLISTTNENPQTHHKLYPRVINTTDINFSQQEMTLLENCPKYSL